MRGVLYSFLGEQQQQCLDELPAKFALVVLIVSGCLNLLRGTTESRAVPSYPAGRGRAGTRLGWLAGAVARRAALHPVGVIAYPSFHSLMFLNFFSSWK